MASQTVSAYKDPELVDGDVRRLLYVLIGVVGDRGCIPDCQFAEQRGQGARLFSLSDLTFQRICGRFARRWI